MNEKQDEIRELITDEVAYRVYVLSTFKDLETKLKYQEGLLEHAKSELGNVTDKLENLLVDHKLCTGKITASLIYEETWKWTHRIKRLWDSILPKVLLTIVLAVAGWLLYVYTIHRPNVYHPPQNQQEIEDRK